MPYFRTGLEELLEKVANTGAVTLHGISPQLHPPVPTGVAPPPANPYRTPPSQHYEGLGNATARETAAPIQRQDVPPGVVQRFGQGALALPGRVRQGARNAGRNLALGAGATLGLGALGAGWAAHKQHEEDDKLRGVAYAPMSGTPGTSFMG
jgi:hypothetical protein